MGTVDPAFAELNRGGIAGRIREAVRARMPLRRHTCGPTTHLTFAVLAMLAACGGQAPEAPAPTSRPNPSDRALEALRAGMTASDPAPILATFDDDVQLHSPALISSDYRGRQIVDSIVTAALQALEGVRVTDVVRSEDRATGGFVFDARVRDQSAQGFVLVRMDGDRVREITLLLRPVAALRAFIERMGELGAQPALDARREPTR